MQLTQFTDYSLRVLLYTGLKMRRATVKEIAKHFHISQNHLLKVVHQMGQYNWIKNYKGKGGGIELVDSTLKLTIADIVRRTEKNMTLLECFDAHTNTCPIMGICKLEKLMKKAQSSFLDELGKVKIEDLVKRQADDARLKVLKIN